MLVDSFDLDSDRKDKKMDFNELSAILEESYFWYISNNRIGHIIRSANIVNNFFQFLVNSNKILVKGIDDDP